MPRIVLFLFMTVSSSCEASGMRGAATTTGTAHTTSSVVDAVRRILFSVDQEHDDDSRHGQQQQRVLQLSSNGLDCSTELSLDVVCVGDCNFTERPTSCESKMFLYHGGSCRNTLASSPAVAASRSTVIGIVTDSAADCQDFHEGPPTELGDEAFVVITDVYNPALTASQQVMVGNYFWTDYEDFPTGMTGWSDTQNITIYRSGQNATYDNMLQTMLFYAPCVDTPLELLDQDQPVQMVAVGMDTKIKADFDLQLKSLHSDRQWQLTSANVAMTVPPYYQGLPVLGLSRSSSAKDHNTTMTVPLTIEMDRDADLTIVATATAVTVDGTAQCTVSTMVSSPFV